MQGEWRLYGRSSSDDKAPIVAMLDGHRCAQGRGRAAVGESQAVLRGRGGGWAPVISSRCSSATPTLLEADAWLFGDGPVHQSRRQQVVFGVRGVTGAEMTRLRPVARAAQRPLRQLGAESGHAAREPHRQHAERRRADPHHAFLRRRRADRARPSAARWPRFRRSIRRCAPKLSLGATEANERVARRAHHASRAQPARHSRRAVGATASNTIPDRRDGVDRLSPRAAADAGARAPLVETHIRERRLLRSSITRRRPPSGMPTRAS